MNASKSDGTHEIHPNIIKPLADRLSEPACELHEATLQQERLPQDCKTTVVLAICKGGLHLEVGTCRILCLADFLYKSLERIIREHLCIVSNRNLMVCFGQLGSFIQKSCLPNLSCSLDKVTGSLDDDLSVKVSYFKVNLAFDSFCYHLRLVRSRNFTIGGKLLN